MKTPPRRFVAYAALAWFFALASVPFAQEPAAAPDAPKPADEKTAPAAAPAPAPIPAPAPEPPAVETPPAAPLRRLDSPEPGTPSSDTRADENRSRADDARQRADDARQRAEQSRQRAAERADQDRARMRERNGHPVVNVFADSFLPKGESAEAVVAVFGSATSNGDVADSVVAVFGNNQVTGPVGNSVVAIFGNVSVDSHVRTVVAIFGNVNLGPNAVVDEEVVCVAGNVERAPGAIVRHHVQNIGRNLPFGDGLRTWVTECLIKIRPLAFHRDLGWAWAVAFSFLGFYALLALIFRGGIEKCTRTLESRPGACVLTAICTVLLAPVTIVVLCIIVVGVVLVPFLGMGLMVASLFGKAVMLAWLGRRFTKFFGDGPLGHPAFAVLVGGLLVLVLYTVPVLGFLTYKFLGWLGLGVVVFTVSQALRREKPAVLPAVPPAAVPPPAMTAGVVAGPPLLETAPLISAATMPRAGFWIRLAALALDGILIAILCGFLTNLFPREAHVHIQVELLPALALYGAAMWKVRGTTIGGIVCGLKVVRIDGREIDWPTAIVRALGCFLSLIVVGLGFIWVAIDDDRQSWHDKIAGTTVVRVPKGISLL